MDESSTLATIPSARIAAFLNRNRWLVRGGSLIPLDEPARPSPAEQPGGAPAVTIRPPRVGPSFAALNRSVLNKTVLNKNKSAFNKNKSGYNKSVYNKNKTQALVTSDGPTEALIPALELRRLHQKADRNSPVPPPFVWEMIDIEAPPGPDHTRLETETLLRMQEDVRERERRRPEIMLEATLDITAFTRPLSIDGRQGYPATYNLFFTILALCEYVGLIYKDRFGRARPNQFEPRLRPMLPIPSHSAYPSNHAFQCFSIAYAFSSLLPEHPASAELFRAARRVAENREWAGLHYASDTLAGQMLARRFLPHLAEACADTLGVARQEWI